MVQWRTMYPLFWNFFVTECTIKLCKLNFCKKFSGTFKFSLLSVHSVSDELGNEKTWPRGYKTFFILNSAEHGIYPAHKC